MNLYRKIKSDIALHEHELIVQTDVFLFLYMVFFNITTSHNGSNKYCNFIGIVFILLAGLYFIHRPDNIINPFSISFSLFTLYAFISTFWSPVREYSLLGVRSFSRILILSVLMYNYLDTERKKDLILSGFVVAGLASSFYTFLYYGMDTFIAGMKNGTRMGSGIYLINYVAVILMMASIISLWFVFYKKKWWDVVPAVICLIVALSTGSRAAVLCFIVGLFTFVFLSFKGKWKIVSPLIMVIIAVLALFVIRLPLFHSINERLNFFLKALSNSGGDESSIVRINMIKWGFEQFLKRPVFGTGVSSGLVVMLEHGESYGLYHNTYIEILAGLGIVGFFLYFFMLFYPMVKLFKPAMQRKDDAVIAMVMLIMLMVAFVFGSDDYTEKATYVIICFLFLTVSHYKREQQEI